MYLPNQDAAAPMGVAALDELHRLCRDAIHSASVASDADFTNRFESMLKQLHYAFSTEEQWMEAVEHPALKCHREQHARVLGALHHVQASVMAGDLGVGRHAVGDLLPKWLSLHIETLDTVLALALRFDERRSTGSNTRQQTEFV